MCRSTEDALFPQQQPQLKQSSTNECSQVLAHMLKRCDCQCRDSKQRANAWRLLQHPFLRVEPSMAPLGMHQHMREHAAPPEQPPSLVLTPSSSAFCSLAMCGCIHAHLLHACVLEGACMQQVTMSVHELMHAAMLSPIASILMM